MFNGGMEDFARIDSLAPYAVLVLLLASVFWFGVGRAALKQPKHGQLGDFYNWLGLAAHFTGAAILLGLGAWWFK